MNKRFLVIVLTIFTITFSFSQKKKGDKYFTKAQYSKAIPYYEKASRKSDPDQLEATIRLGDCYRSINEYKKAEESYKKALTIDPKINSADFRYNYGSVLKTNNNYSEALEQFKAYLQENPKDVRTKNAIKSCQQIKYWMAKPTEYEIKNVEGINTEKSEFCPAILNNHLVFVGEKQTDFIEYGTNDLNGMPYLNVYIAKINIAKATDQKSFSNRINSYYDDGPVSFSADGKTLLFTKVNYVEKRKDKNFVNRAKIYFATGHDRNWANIKPFQYNSDEYSVAHPSLSADNNYLYFTSDMPGGYGGKDIWYCKRNGDGWDKPVNLGPDINTSGDEMFPYIRKDETLFFSSNGLSGFGGLDVFTAKIKYEKWILNRNESLLLNSSADDFGVCFANDSTGYFSSNREGGKGKDDIYWFKYTNRYINVSGTVLLTENINDPAIGVKVKLLGEDGVAIDSMKTNERGYFDFRDLDAEKKYLAEISSDDPQLQGKARYYLANGQNIIARVTNSVNGSKFVFRNLPVDPNQLPDLYTDDNLTLAGNLLYGENPSQPLKNVKITATNKFGDVVETTTTNEFGAFAFRNLPADQNFILSIDDKDVSLAPNTKITLTNKSGKEIKTFIFNKSGFKFNILAAEKTMLSDMDVADADLIMDLYGYVYDQDKKALGNAKLNLYNSDGQLNQTLTTDEKGKFSFRNLKADKDYLFDLDMNDIRLSKLTKILIGDSRGRLYREIVKNVRGTFEFKLLEVDKVTLGEFTVDDPWLQVLQMKNKAKQDSLTIIENIYYASAEYRLDAAGQKVLDKVIGVMNSNQKISVELSSHTDSKAGDAYNLALSVKRAKAAVDYMVSKGIDKKRLKAVGYGETRLLNKCGNGVECTDDEHAKNRRTEFKIVDTAKS